MKRLALAALSLALLGGCDGRVTSAADAPPIARVHRAKCGTCHMRVEQGAMPRPELERALSRHRSRVPLREEEWNALVEYLAAEKLKSM